MTTAVAENEILEETVPVAPPSATGEPAWAVALLFPYQGEWTEESYLALETNHLVELVDGCLEVLPMPAVLHQRIVKWLFQMLNAYVVANSMGEVLFAPLRVRLFPGQIREPDIVYLKPGRIVDYRTPPHGADLFMEVVSEGNESRIRDYEVKKEAYSKAGISEYWIVDPQERRITVLVLDGNVYRVHGEFTPGMTATSVLLPGFAVEVTATFSAGEGSTAG